VGQGLLEERTEFADAFNFGPSHVDNLPVSEVAERTRAAWPKATFEFPELEGEPHEAGLLQLDCTKARNRLSWNPVWDADEAIGTTISWYRDYYEQSKVRSLEDLQRYVRQAKENGAIWA
jgi:CDP-glucose 4,6-dehydratase